MNRIVPRCGTKQRGLLIAVLLFVIATPFASAAPSENRSATPGLADPAELEAFLDGLIETTLTTRHIAGATVAVVKDGRLFFAKGYGQADVETEAPVVADQTLFRIASVSKLFVWTAVMQLVEQGRLDLHADINTYLRRFQIPDTYDTPITLAHILSHTTGFEARVIGLLTHTPEALLPLGEVLARQLPRRVRPPGQVAAYSNHATAMAAHIVEEVSGLPWETYAERYIFAPLAMHRTSFRQILPDALAETVSKGYASSDDSFAERPFELVPLNPAGGASTTATDMAAFMLAHLMHGQGPAGRLLDSTTVAQMHRPLFRHTPAMNAMVHGFMDYSRNGQWVIGHGGNTAWFHSMLAVLPEHGVGLFVSFNTDTGAQAAPAVFEAFMDRYYPAPAVEALMPSPEAREGLRRFAGRYERNRKVHSTLAKMAAAFSTTEVRLTDDGALLLRVPGPGGWSAPTRWVQTGPLTFREENGPRTVAFREDDGGAITHLFYSDVPILAMEKIAGVANPAFHLALLLGAGVLFLGTALFWPVAALMRRRYRVTLAPEARIPPAARRLLWATSLLFVLFLIGLTIALSDPNQLFYGVTLGLKGVLVLPLAAAALTVGALGYGVRLWRSKQGRAPGRLYYSVVTLAFVAFLWQLHYWNLLGFQY